MVAKNLRTTYLYIISFVALMTMFGSAISAVSSIADYSFPTKEVRYYYDDYSYSYSDAGRYYDDYEYSYPGNNLIEPVDVDEEVNAADDAISLENQKINALRRLTTSIVTFAIATILFILHWMPVKKLHRKELAEETARESGVM